MNFALLFGPVIILMAVFFAQMRIERRLRDQEIKVAKLQAHLGIDLDAPSEPSDIVKELARTPVHYIAAIRTYREQTGAGFKEAKAVVDKLALAANPPAA